MRVEPIYSHSLSKLCALLFKHTKPPTQKSHKHKSSGLLCCTGTGSTAWMLALRKIRGDDAAAMLDIMQEMLRERYTDAACVL